MNPNLLARIADPEIANPALAQFQGAQQGNALYKLSQGREADSISGAAAGGDKNALARLYGLDFDRAKGIADTEFSQKRAVAADGRAAAAEGRAAATFNRAEAAAKAEKIAGVLYGADTPEKFSQAIAFLQAQGMKIDPATVRFEDRENYINQTLTAADQIKRGIDIAKAHADAAKAAAEANKPLSKEGRLAYDRERGLVPAAPPANAAATTAGGIVVEDIDRTLGIVKANPKSTTGLGGWLLSNVAGTNARNVDALVTTIKTNAAFDKLQEMRKNSPTGGALGNVSDTENKMLASAIGNLEQSQGTEQFVDNLKRVKNIYLDIIHGPGQGPPREELGFNKGKPGAGPVQAAPPAAGQGAGAPPMQGARQAPDGNWYVPNPAGGWFKVQP